MGRKSEARNSGKPALLHGRDTVLAAVILAAAAALFYITTTFERVSDLLAQNIGPEFFPQLVLVVIVLLTVGLPFEHRFIRGGRARLDSGRSRPVAAPTWLTAGFLLVIAALMPVVGTLVTMVLVCLVFPPLWGNFRFRVVLPFAVAFPLAVWLVFAVFLKVHFEPGLLAGLLG